MKAIRLIAVVLFLSIRVAAQLPTTPNGLLINGFANKVSGDDFSYHSLVPGVDKSLIVRATNGKYAMEWQTDKVPMSVSDDYVVFVWLAAVGSSPGFSDMILTVNGSDSIVFHTDGKKEWTIRTANKTELFFTSGMEDQVGDKFGFMFLRMPTANIEKGKPLTLKVTGGDYRKSSWYMTFQMPVRTGMSVKVLPALINDEGNSKQLVSGNILYFGQPTEAKIYIDGKLAKRQQLGFGVNHLRLGISEAKQKKAVRFRLEAGSFVQELKIEQQPVRKWQVNFVQHSHTDIGYTRSQTEILAEHLRYIDYALDYCDATDNYPDEAKFRWTCEASWAVDEFLKCRPTAQIERLKKRVKEGRIELTSMYFNFDELPEEQVLAASLQPLKRFKENGLHSLTAMQNDVNGIAWCMNDFYNSLGVKYLNMGTHGHRALICFDKPTLFWWESPSGNRMLAYRAEHYMTGNTVFGIDKGDVDYFGEKMLEYLVSLAETGYPHDVISIQHSGYLTDNSPPSTVASDVIRKWNERYEWPKLKTSTATAFFEEMESKYSASFPVYRGAWPDWWTDGFGASAREVAAARKAQSDITANSAGLVMAAIQGSPMPQGVNERIALINSALLFYTEHTVGYSESVREPYHEQTMEQRAIKESYAWESYRRAKMLGEEAMGLLQSHIANEAKPSIVIYNTLNWQRDGLVTVYIDHQLVPRGTHPKLTDHDGNIYQAQALSHRSDGTYWAIWAKNIPAFGYKKLQIDIEESLPEKVRRIPTQIVENQWYKLAVDHGKATVSSWYDKELNVELVDASAPHAMGEFIYELLENRHQMEQKRLSDFKRFPFDSARFESYSEGPVWNTIRMKGNTMAAYENSDVDVEIRLFNSEKRIDFVYSIVKKPIVDPEGIYIAFPFRLPDGKLYFDVQGGVVEAGKDQIPGSSNDWNTVQHFAALRNAKSQVVMVSPEMPLMQFGGINTGRYKAGALPSSTHIYSWPMNNYWVTNFNPDQKGQHVWTYSLTSGSKVSNSEATRFGWGVRVPFLARILPGGGVGETAWEKSFVNGWPENLLLVNSQPVDGERKALIHVRETDGKPADLSTLMQTDGLPFKIEQTDVLGESIHNGTTILNPFESGFFRLSW